MKLLRTDTDVHDGMKLLGTNMTVQDHQIQFRVPRLVICDDNILVSKPSHTPSLMLITCRSYRGHAEIELNYAATNVVKSWVRNDGKISIVGNDTNKQFEIVMFNVLRRINFTMCSIRPLSAVTLVNYLSSYVFHPQSPGQLWGWYYVKRMNQDHTSTKKTSTCLGPGQKEKR